MEMIDLSRPTMITGDFNISLKSDPNNLVTSTLLAMGFKQLVNCPTQIQGGWIDHAYWRNTASIWKEPTLEIYSPYYSDHEALLLTLQEEE